MGVLGAEVRAAGEVLVRSCPAKLPATASPGLWVRTLLAGTDSVVVLVVNDTSKGTTTGTTIRTVSPAHVRVLRSSKHRAGRSLRLAFRRWRSGL